MARPRQMINKLQAAIVNKGCILKINTYQFYSKEQNRMITGYSLLTPEWKVNKKGEKVLRDTEILNTCAQIRVVKFLADLYKRLNEDKKMDGG